MPVLVWVLGDVRVAPRGFYEIKIDEMRINWLSAGANDRGANGLVSLAANEAGGKAFVTEYAGSSMIASMQVYRNGQFNMAALQQAQEAPRVRSAADLDGPHQRPADAAAAVAVHPDARRAQDDGRHRSEFYNGINGLLGRVRVSSLRPCLG